jgi:hypothetical protein
MACIGKAILLIWTDIPAEEEHDFNNWYNREHLRSRAVEVPGFHRGRRYVALSGSPKYLAFYEVESTSILQSETYLAGVRNPDPLSRRFIPQFQNTVRIVADVAESLGEGEGGILGLLPLTPAESKKEEVKKWLPETVLPGLLNQYGIVGVHFWHTNRSALGSSASGHMRKDDRVIDWFLAVEATMEKDLDIAAQKMLQEDTIRQRGAEPEASLSTFRLLYSLSAKG